MTAIPHVGLKAATPEDATLLANLLQLYIHDLSEIFAVEIGPDGRFTYPKLPLYWSEPKTHFPFLIRSGERIAGFALITRGSPASDDPAALDIAEFFVLRGHRRAGVGKQAAVQLWNRFRGPWVVRVSEGNRAGVPFWNRAIHEYTHGTFTESSMPGNQHPWRVFSFLSRPSEAAS